MRSRTLLFLALVLTFGFSRPANAQFGVYGEFSGGLIGSGYLDPTGLQGVTAGAYYNPMRFGALAFGLDARGSFLTGSVCCDNRIHIKTFLVGPRASFSLKHGRVKPYAEYLIGVGSAADTNSGANTNTTFAYQLTGGLDVAILPRLDWRILEANYERGPDDNIASDAQTGTLSTGVVFHF